MSREFSSFESTNVQGTDEPVGFRPGAVANVANKRWTFNAILGWIQGIIDIQLLNRTQSNHISAQGSAVGGTPQIATVGADTNIPLRIGTQGNSSVLINAPLSTEGNDIDTSGGDVLLDGGALNTQGGAISTANGAINLGSGNLNSTGDALVRRVVTTFTSTLAGVFAEGPIFLSGATASIDGAGKNMTIGNVDATTLNATGALTAGSVNTNSLASSTGLSVTGTTNLNSQVNVITGFAHTVNVLAAGATQGAVLVSRSLNRITSVPTAGDGVTLTSVPVAPRNGQIYYVKNDGDKSMSVWPPSGFSIDGGAANAPATLGVGEAAMFVSIPAFLGENYFTMRFAGVGGSQQLGFRTTAVDATFVDSDYLIEATAGSTFSLPTASGRQGKIFVLKNSTGVAVSLAAFGAETIDGLATQPIGASDAIKVASNGTNWIII